jgi:hypothetical protein
MLLIWESKRISKESRWRIASLTEIFKTSKICSIESANSIPFIWEKKESREMRDRELHPSLTFLKLQI